MKKTFQPKGAKATEFKKLRLTTGSHDSPEDGMCVMEAVAYFQDQSFTDRPPCVDRRIANLAIGVNDSITSGEDDDVEKSKKDPGVLFRTRLLKPLIPKMVGTSLKGGLSSPKNRDIYRRRAEALYFTFGKEVIPRYLEAHNGYMPSSIALFQKAKTLQALLVATTSLYIDSREPDEPFTTFASGLVEVFKGKSDTAFTYMEEIVSELFQAGLAKSLEQEYATGMAKAIASMASVKQ